MNVMVSLVFQCRRDGHLRRSPRRYVAGQQCESGKASSDAGERDPALRVDERDEDGNDTAHHRRDHQPDPIGTNISPSPRIRRTTSRVLEVHVESVRLKDDHVLAVAGDPDDLGDSSPTGADSTPTHTKPAK